MWRCTRKYLFWLLPQMYFIQFLRFFALSCLRCAYIFPLTNQLTYSLALHNILMQSPLCRDVHRAAIYPLLPLSLTLLQFSSFLCIPSIPSMYKYVFDRSKLLSSDVFRRYGISPIHFHLEDELMVLTCVFNICLSISKNASCRLT